MSHPTDEVRVGRDARHLNALYTPEMIVHAKGVMPCLAKDGGRAYHPAYSGDPWEAESPHSNYVYHKNEVLTVHLADAYATHFGASTLVVYPPMFPWAAQMSQCAAALGDAQQPPSQALCDFAGWLMAQLLYSRLVQLHDGRAWERFLCWRDAYCSEMRMARLQARGGRPEGDHRIPHLYWNLPVRDPFCYVARIAYLEFLVKEYLPLAAEMEMAIVRHEAAKARGALVPCPAPQFLPDDVKAWIRGAREDSGCETYDEKGRVVYTNPVADPAFSYDMCRLLGCWSLANHF